MQVRLFLLLDILLLILFVVLEFDIVCSLLFVMWSNMTLYALQKLATRSMLFAFSISFFSFLMGREILQSFFGYEVEFFSKNINRHADICLLLSLISVFVSYLVFNKDQINLNQPDMKKNQAQYLKTIRQYSYYLFWFLLFFSIIYAIFLALFVSSVGYIELYTAENRNATRGSLLLIMLNRIEQMLPVVLCCFFSTMPDKKSSDRVSKYYCIYLFLTLLSGRRGPCILGLLFLLIYYFYRNNNRDGIIWVQKKWMKLGVLLSPFILSALGLLSQLRVGEDITYFSLGKSVIDFIYNNGVSINVIKRAYEFEANLNSDRFYSLHFLHEGVIGLIMGGGEEMGNSLVKATEGYHLAHALSFILMGDRYINGGGVGTSYVAELYHDFGYLGVVLGSLLYGFLMAKISNISQSSPFYTAIKLLIITQILWAPRGGFTEFITILFLPATIFVFFAVFGGAILKNGIRCR